jgi:hypothetical protein
MSEIAKESLIGVPVLTKNRQPLFLELRYLGKDMERTVPFIELVALGWDFFRSRSLQRGAEFAALTAEKVGDPEIRESLEEHYIPAHLRAREYMARAG